MYTKKNEAQSVNVTEEHLRNEFDYEMAQQMLLKMLGKGLISLDEFDKIAARNLEIFSPELASIIA